MAKRRERRGDNSRGLVGFWPFDTTDPLVGVGFVVLTTVAVGVAGAGVAALVAWVF